MAEKSIVFDTGTVISLALNNLLWILKPLKERFGGEFYITPLVKMELIDRPLRSKKFSFEALQCLKLLRDGILTIYDNKDLVEKRNELLDTANKAFNAFGHDINIVHGGEMEVLAASIILGSEAIAVDERTTRYMIESPSKLLKRLKSKLHTKVKSNKTNSVKLKKLVKNVKVLRSVELVVIAFELGLLDELIPPDQADGKKTLIKSALWGLKLNGCAISKDDLREIVRLEKRYY